MKKLFLLALLFCSTAMLAAAEVKEFALAGYKFRAFAVDVKDLGNGELLLTSEAMPNNWPLVHIMPGDSSFGKVTSVAFTMQIVEAGSGERISLEFKPKGIARTMTMRSELKDGKAHSYRVNLDPKQSFTGLMLAFAKPRKVTSVKISGIKFDTKPIALKEKLAPMPPVMFKGKPFFPIGAYDRYGLPRTEFGIDPGLIAAGGNTMLIGGLGLPGHVHYKDYRQPVLFRSLEYAKNAPEYQNMAFFISLDAALSWDASEAETHGLGGYHKPLTPEQIKERTKFLANDLRRLRQYPNILGYLHDEPENLAYKYFKRHYSDKWNKDREKALSVLMLDAYSWIHNLIRKEHPEAKLTPILAWWTSYQVLGDFYDINIPNEYPDGNPGSKEFEGDFFTVNYDAAMAAKAIRALGNGKTFIYMPGTYQRSTLGSNRRSPTYRETRYTCFAPITRGAMGVFGWRLLRCDAEYRDNVVFPVLAELDELKEYFLGEWHDEKVISDHDTASVDYLKKFKEFSRMMAGEKDGDVKVVKDAVPDVSYCLRRNPVDNSYLLLVVNNRREAITVNFTLALQSLPPTAKCAIDRHFIRIKNNSFTDKFDPFDVHAYIIKPTK